jgi:hypothetical protein
MTEPELYTQLVRVTQVSSILPICDSFISMGFSVRPYFTDSGVVSRWRFYVDYTSAGRVDLWYLKYGSVYPGVVFTEVVYE